CEPEVQGMTPETLILKPQRCPPRTLRASEPATPTVPRLGGWLAFLCLNLLAYALLGRGWAHVGVPPIFVGELVLFCGVVTFFLFGRWRELFDLPAVWCLFLLQIWGVYRTLPYLSTYGADALRDAVLWGYSVFALLVFGVILAQPARLAALFQAYRKF